jgi:hypothetical protein
MAIRPTQLKIVSVTQGDLKFFPPVWLFILGTFTVLLPCCHWLYVLTFAAVVMSVRWTLDCRRSRVAYVRRQLGIATLRLRLEERAEQRGPPILKVAFPLEPRFNRASIRCCVSGHVSAVWKALRARGRSAYGNETWLMRFFAAAIGRRSKEAIRRASTSTKQSSSASGSARLISVSFRGVAV